ncbi:MarR family transcriptional regulator [Tistrella mobilis]|uniref:MarR family winged helix-turn-helix transcriptional regulator n=1 Tax=Tistrella mobilis TaxID=171437 RepID=UPI003558FA2C
MDTKYQALIDESRRRGLTGLDRLRTCMELLSTARAIDRDCAIRLGRHGLSEGRFVLLFLLRDRAEGLAPHVLADRAGVTRGTITGLLDGLERDGFVRRRPDPEDRRRVRVMLTKSGETVSARAFQEHAVWIAGLTAGLSAEEQAEFARLLGKLRAGLASEGGS